MNSPVVKAFGDERITAGETCLIVDLGDCTGMDSTFMGTLAGIAARLSVQEGGVLQIADTGERNRRSLEDLGLDFLMEINPPAAVWRGKVDAIRQALNPPPPPGTIGQLQRARHILDAHQMLTGMSELNARKFEGVVTLLGKELAAADPPGEQPESPQG